MTEIISLGVITGTLFICFIGMFSYGVILQKRPVIISSIICLTLFIISGTITGYHVITKTYHKTASILQPRTGEEIYNGLFKPTKNDCIKILNYQDQVIPKIDFAIFLHFKTCPGECSRILSEYKYQKGMLETKDWN